MAKAAKMRVVIPTSPKELLTLIENVYQHHLSLGDKSPLLVIEGHDWAVDGPASQEALGFHNKAEILKKEMETAYRERDLRLNAAKVNLKASRDLLTGIYTDNMKRMGEWGFTVDDTPKLKKAPVPKPV